MDLSEQIKALREKTGAGMMDCKRALVDSGGDFDKALEALRKKGLADAAKKSARTTKSGAVAAFVSADGKSAALVEVNCETDFVGKTPDFQALSRELAQGAAEGRIASPEAAKERLAQAVAKLGENIVLRRLERFSLSGPGLLAPYIHADDAGSRKGALLQLKTASEGAAARAEVQSLGKELAMQVVAMSPKWVRKEEVPAADVAKEREIFASQVRAEGKPEAAVPKIVEGKLHKLFFQQWVLLEQMSMRDNKTPIPKLLADAAKAAGGAVDVERFARYQLGGD